MEKNVNNLMSKAKEISVLVLFTIIYIFLQKIILVAFFLFLMAFMISYGKTIEILIIPLIIMLAFVYYFGYLSKDFFQKINKLFTSSMMIIILIYFIYFLIMMNLRRDRQQSIFFVQCRIFHL